MSNLYNKYNPKNFEEVIGQTMSIKILKHLCGSKNIPNGILLTGIHGVGKTLLARIFAKAINCSSKTINCSSNIPQPCDQCNNCIKINQKTNDIIEVDGATYTGVDNIRKIIEGANYLPQDVPYKVYIIDEVHMLSRSAFDALLMTLQDPPQSVKFIFATTRPDKLPDTFLSRCICIHLNRINHEELIKFLSIIAKKESQNISSEILETIVEVSDGSVRRAMSLLELVLILQPKNHEEVLDYLKVFSTDVCLDILKLILDGKPQQAITQWNKLYKKGYDEKSFLHRMAKILTNLSLLKLNESIEEQEKYSEIIKKYDISFKLLFHYWEIIIGQTEAMYNGCGALIETTIIMLSLVEEQSNVTSSIKKIFQ